MAPFLHDVYEMHVVFRMTEIPEVAIKLVETPRSKRCSGGAKGCAKASIRSLLAETSTRSYSFHLLPRTLTGITS